MNIDLLPEGVRAVQQGVLGADDIALSYWRLARSGAEQPKGEELLKHFLVALSGQADNTCQLFVFDNFETVAAQAELFRWIERAVRNPNKVLITTRESAFRGDFPIEVGGMLDDEFTTLVMGTARTLGVEGIITESFIDEAYRESDGHPYVAKILVGDVRRTGRTGSVTRILADREDILTALFQRTFTRSLSPIAQRLFLTLSAWRSSLPEVAIKAAMLRPSNERIDVDAALEEFTWTSMLEAIVDPDGERWYRVPGSAQLFGQAKLGASPDRAEILADVAVLQAFGAAQDSDIRRGVPPRLENLVRWATQRLEAQSDDLEPFEILEYVASRYPQAWMAIADVRRGLTETAAEIEAVRRFVEAAPRDAAGWRRLAALYRQTGEVTAELEATLQLVALPNTPYRELSQTAAGLNGLIRDGAVDAETKSVMAERLRRLMEGRLSEADASDLAQIGWLCVHMKDYERAVELARRGLAVEPDNQYCLRLVAFRW